MLNKQQQADWAKWRDSALVMAKLQVPSLTPDQAGATIGAGLWAALEFWTEHPEASAQSVLEFMGVENAEPK